MDSWIEGLPAGWFAGGAPPLQIDVGSHRGTFLAAMAGDIPGTNFLGIERLSGRVERANSKFARRGLANARAVRAGGREALLALPEGCAEGIHVLFPDPWPKRRHAPRRMVDPAFLAACARVLAPGGFLRVGTDEEFYGRLIREALAGCREFVDGGPPPVFPPTEFEARFLREGKTAHWIYAVRLPAEDIVPV